MLTPLLHFYTYEKEKIVNSQTVNLGEYTFGTHADKNLYQAVTTPLGSNDPGVFSKAIVYFETLTDDHTNVMNQSNSKMKLYPFKDKIILTIDIRKFTTRIFTFSLDDFTYEYKEVKHQETLCDDTSYLIDSNSFLKDGNLFQVSHCKKQTSLSIYNLETDKVVQSFQAGKKGGTSFRNSPFIQDGGFKFFKDGVYKEISNKTGFKRLSKGNISVFPFQKGDEIELTIGSDLYRRATSDSSIGFVSESSVAPSIGRIAFTRRIYFKSLVNGKSFEHVEENLEGNIFEEIGTLENQSNENINKSRWSGKIIFKYKDYYLLSYYVKDENSFVIMKFDAL